jgi:hypothetical protein
VSHLLLTVNSSLNFLVYTCCTAPFRDRLISLLKPKSSSRRRVDHHINSNEEEEGGALEMVGTRFATF